jgi:hypothetical protein
VPSSTTTAPAVPPLISAASHPYPEPAAERVARVMAAIDGRPWETMLPQARAAHCLGRGAESTRKSHLPLRDGSTIQRLGRPKWALESLPHSLPRCPSSDELRKLQGGSPAPRADASSVGDNAGPRYGQGWRPASEHQEAAPTGIRSKFQS